MPQIDTLNIQEELALLEFKEEIWEKLIEIIEEGSEPEGLEGEELLIELPQVEETSEQKEEISLELWGVEDKKKNKTNFIKIIFRLHIPIYYTNSFLLNS